MRQVAKLDLPPLNDTDDVWFETTLEHIHETTKSELNLAACHSRLELACARHLDLHPRVATYVRNFQLGWTIPYHLDGVWRSYHPDFVARLDNDVNLIIECKGRPDDKAEATKRFVLEHWIPSVANTDALDRGLRRWGFVELTDERTISADLTWAIALLPTTPAGSVTV